MKLQDEVTAYKGFWNSDGHCRLRVYRTDAGGVVAIATELPDNPGTSITNLAEQLATAVFQREEVSGPEHFTWIEHYPKRNIGKDVRPESYDLVTFDFDPGYRRFSHPRWRRIDQATLERLVGERPEVSK